jgi:LPXTG-motif cell wall-anchored protein
MSVRSRLLAAAGCLAVALVIAAPAAHAVLQPPPGATVSDALECRDGDPMWLVSMANSGPDQLIDYTLQSDGGTKVDYEVPIGPLMQRLMPAKSGGSHLTVLADGATMVDNTQSIKCGASTTTVPPTTLPRTTIPPTTVPHTTTTAVIVAKTANDPAPTAAPAAPAAQAPAAASLPRTGSSSVPLAFFGSALVLAGAATLLSSRRRSA